MSKKWAFDKSVIMTPKCDQKKLLVPDLIIPRPYN